MEVPSGLQSTPSTTLHVPDDLTGSQVPQKPRAATDLLLSFVTAGPSLSGLQSSTRNSKPGVGRIWSVSRLATCNRGTGTYYMNHLVAVIRLGQIRNLKYLQFLNIPLDDGDMIELSQAMDSGSVSMLKRLNLSSNQFGMHGAKAPARVIRNGHLSSLWYLAPNGNKIGDSGCLDLADAVDSRTVEHLRHLLLGGMRFREGEDGLILLASKLESGHLSKLETLTVGGIHLGVKDFCRRFGFGRKYVMTRACSEALVQAYRKNPRLTLTLRSNWMLKITSKEMRITKVESEKAPDSRKVDSEIKECCTVQINANYSASN